jgi:recombination protein RecR
MNSALPPSVENLIEALRVLPGVGQKTATRLAFFLLRSQESTREKLGNAVLDATKNLKKCAECGHFSEEEICGICRDDRRDASLICVVEDSLDLLAMEKTGIFKGKYHVLGGALSPIDGIGPQDLRIDELVVRLQNGEIEEIILATNPSFEGEATASLVHRKCAEIFSGSVTRLARGIPVGGDVEYADEITLTRALENRLRF